MGKAEIATEVTAEDEWAVGLHGESSIGQVALGLCLEHDAIGMVLKAPGVGTLNLAFDIEADGITRLSTAKRRLSDGQDAVLLTLDHSRALGLERELDRLIRTNRALEAENQAQSSAHAKADDESQSRAAGLFAHIRRLEDERAQLQSEVEALKTSLHHEKEEGLAAQGELAVARAELERVRHEHEEGTTGLTSELAEALTRISNLQAERDEARSFARQLHQKTSNFAKTENELVQARERIAILEAELNGRTTGLENALPTDPLAAATTEP